MICPRCGTDNPIPEATKHRCHSCGYSLIGEVSKHDIHSVAARNAAIRVFLLLAILGSLVYAVIITDWFGLKSGPFTPSQSLSVTNLFAPDPIPFAASAGSVVLLPAATIDVEAVVFLNQRYADGELAKVSERDLVVAWADVAEAGRKSIDVVPHDRTVQLTSSNVNVDAKTLVEQTAVFHVVPANDTIKKVLENLHPGSKVGLSGFTVSTSLPSGTRLNAVTTGTEENEPKGYIVYVTGLTYKSKVFGVAVGQ